MASPTVLLSKLDAVNMMLSSIGQAPVNSISTGPISSVNMAVLTLDNVTREVLTNGWSFNTDTEYELATNVDGRIQIPAGALFVDPSDPQLEFITRYYDGSPYLYDTARRSFTILQHPLKVDIIWAFEFEELPNHVRQYIATRAARIFQSQDVGSEILYKFTETMEAEALALARRMEGRQKDRNWFNTNSETNAILFRHRNPKRFA